MTYLKELQSQKQQSTPLTEAEEVQVLSSTGGSKVGPVSHDDDDTEVEEEVTEDTPTTAPPNEEDTETEPTEEPAQEASYTDEDRQLFSQMFTDTFGVSVDEAKALMSNIQQVQQVANILPFAQAWSVGMDEAQRRVEQVLDYIEKLPEAESKKLLEKGTMEDVLQVYDRIATSKGQKKGLFSGKTKAGSAPVSTTRGKPVFTQAEIDAMPPSERRRRDPEILLAYQEGRVR